VSFFDIYWHYKGFFLLTFLQDMVKLIIAKELEMTKLELFYDNNMDELESRWAEYLSEGEWGSGEDRMFPDDECFWEWVEQIYYAEVGSLA
jgi:hypothetical protein